MNEKQQQLTFDKGITNVPSDALCSDNALEESVGMIYDNGEHRVIQYPVEFITSAYALDGTTAINIKLLFIHKFNNQERYIVSIETTTHGTTYDIIVWGIKSGTTFFQKGSLAISSSALPYLNSTQITSVGKTLIVSDENGIHYFIWKGTSQTPSYQNYERLPEISFKPYVSSEGNGYEQITQPSDGIIERTSTGYEVHHDKQDELNNLLVGIYSKLKKLVCQKKGFCNPFLLMAGLELYDGSYTMLTNPILMLPSIDGRATGWGYSDSSVIGRLEYCFLRFSLFSQITDYGDFSDLVKDVVIFASKPIDVLDTGVDQNFDPIPIGSKYYTNKMWIGHDSTYNYNAFHKDNSQSQSLIVRRDTSEVNSDIESTSKFYKLCSIGLRSVSNAKLEDYIDVHCLENLTAQTFIETSDYFSHASLSASMVYSYNSRLNLANVMRGFFEGFETFLPYDNTQTGEYRSFVTIRTDEGDKVIEHDYSTKEKQGLFFYYPDSRAKHVQIYKKDVSVYKRILDADLKEHEGLNGAYYFAGMPTADYTETFGADQGTIDTNNGDRECLANVLVTSEVNNPFAFDANGYYSVGMGRINGVSTITQALSEGQFGQYPLLVFSTDGIWALSVGSTGYYTSSHPMSREVCNNAGSITQTDGAVFFTSDKGLMVISGNQVKCVSEQLSGKNERASVGGSPMMSSYYDLGNFLSFLKTCHIAYDYRDSLLWLFSNDAKRVCYLYSMKSGTFGKFEFDTLTNSTFSCINNYPDYLIQMHSNGKVYSLTGRTDINDAAELNNNTYGAHLLTRPMKLENTLALKSIMQVMHVCQFTPYTVSQQQTKGSIKLSIFASNNLDGTWEQLLSLRGRPWKYYRFRYDFNGLKATDRFSGTMLVTQERRTDKLR